MGRVKYNPYRKPPLMRKKMPPYVPREIVPRDAWGALSPLGTSPMEPTALPVDNVILTYFTKSATCADSDSCQRTLREIQLAQMSTGIPDIAYNFLIGGDLKIYEGRGWDWKPEKHDSFPDIHNDSIEIAFIGDYREVQVDEMAKLITESFYAIDLGVQYKNVREFFNLKESTPKIRIDTFGESDGRERTPVKRSEVQVEFPDAPPSKPPTRHPYY